MAFDACDGCFLVGDVSGDVAVWQLDNSLVTWMFWIWESYMHHDVPLVQLNKGFDGGSSVKFSYGWKGNLEKVKADIFRGAAGCLA